MTPAQEEKAAVYKELGYRPAGMVGKHLTARPMKTRKEVHGPGHGGGREDGDTLFRYRYGIHKMYTYTIKADALAVEIEASTIDAAAVMFGRSVGLSGGTAKKSWSLFPGLSVPGCG